LNTSVETKIILKNTKLFFSNIIRAVIRKSHLRKVWLWH